MTRKFSLLQVLAAIALAACAPGESVPSASGSNGASPEAAMKDTLYEPGRTFVRTYCSPCHWSGGQNPKKSGAYKAFQVDTYEEWASGRTIISAVLDKWNPDGSVMPPPEAPLAPPDDERKLILDWVHRGSPNTPTGM
jgi:hypothetical protein